VDARDKRGHDGDGMAGIALCPSRVLSVCGRNLLRRIGRTRLMAR
jgi:hypothetical protein